MNDFFLSNEVTIATANVYYEDASSERVVPSEISLLKFSIDRGIFEQRHYILAYDEPEMPSEACRKEAVENEQRTGLLMNCDGMSADVRNDCAEIWNEIKDFTAIDGDSAKLLLLSDDWNIVVGSFDALFVRAKETSFCMYFCTSVGY
ncbi:unnamed protein product [Gongylonema pulchrum]|uniref:Uncharacterized protein n=1 Tax=Gongylonema pulchrum TaxID=637853 RepID=A0A3P7QGT1_9BILA|nr:unnamed protein product [Gongylonema pulchrum]